MSSNGITLCDLHFHAMEFGLKKKSFFDTKDTVEGRHSLVNRQSTQDLRVEEQLLRI